MRASGQIRTRAELVATERGLNQAELKAAHARRLVDFADRRELSLDWLACGDLRGLHRQTRWLTAVATKSGYR
ncbi:MAG: hypothetical protein WBY67_17660 [Pseudolabrys sp.]